MGAAGGALLWAQTTITGPGPMTVGTTNATDVNLVTNNMPRVIVSSAGHLLPAVGNTYNLGSSTLQWGSAWLGGNLSVGGNGSITGNLSVTGNVGIGTSAPAQKLHVVGNVQFTGALMPAGAAGSTGQVLVSQGAGTAPQWWTITDDGSGTIVVTPGGGQITIGALNNNAIWNADRLQGNSVSSTMPMADQVLAWDGVANPWQPKSLSAGTGITITGLTIAAQNTNPIWNADQLCATNLDCSTLSRASDEQCG
jgi:hypothetical protein